MSYENAPATQMLAVYCACCARPLVDAASVEAGIGPDCRKAHGYAEAQGEPDWAAVLRETDGLVSVRDLLGASDLPGREETTLAAALNVLESTWLLGGVETRRVANLLVHRIACEQTGVVALALTNAVRALGFRRLADRIGQRLAKIRITREGEAYLIEAPYSEAKVAAFRAIPGRKRVTDHGRHGADRFPVAARGALNQALRRLYPGTIASGPKGLFTL